MQNEKKVIKISLGTMSMGIAFLVLITFLGTHLYLNAIGIPNIFNLKGTQDEVEIKPSEETTKVRKLDESKDFVYTYASKESVSIPTLNIDSKDAEQINEKIKSRFKIEDSGNASLEYKSYVNNNILSLVLMGEYPSLYNYVAYNIDLYTGEAVDNSQILQHKNISAQELYSNIPEIYKKQFVEMFGTLEEHIETRKEWADGTEDIEGWKEEYQRFQEANYTAEYYFDIDKNDMYLDENNNLNLILSIAYPAGSKGANSYIVNTGI